MPKSSEKFDHKMRYATFKQMHFYYKFNLQSKNYRIGMVQEFV